MEAYKDANSGRYPFADHAADVRFEFTAPYPALGTTLGVSPPGTDPQLGVSRVLAALPQEVIFVEAVYRHHGTGAAYRNDGAAYLQKPTPR